MAWILGECGWSIITTFSVSGKFSVIFPAENLTRISPSMPLDPKVATRKLINCWCAITTRPGSAPCSERRAACGVARTVSDIH